MEKLISDFSFGLFFWQALLFLTLLFLLRKFAWKPILKAVTDREESIETALKSAEKAREEIANLTADNERILNEAKEERTKILKEAKVAGQKLVEEAKDKASVEATRLIESAKQEINNQKMAAVVEVKNQVAQLSIEIAEKILKDKLNTEDAQKAFVGNLLEDIKLN